jgi:hypothetical protein
VTIHAPASTENLKEVEKWVGHIGQQLDGIIAERADAPYQPFKLNRARMTATAICAHAGNNPRTTGQSGRSSIFLQTESAEN